MFACWTPPRRWPSRSKRATVSELSIQFGREDLDDDVTVGRAGVPRRCPRGQVEQADSAAREEADDRVPSGDRRADQGVDSDDPLVSCDRGRLSPNAHARRPDGIPRSVACLPEIGRMGAGSRENDSAPGWPGGASQGLSSRRPGPELNRRIELLQSSALPLGYQAADRGFNKKRGAGQEAAAPWISGSVFRSI
jgi:hypothetical protein